MGEYLCDKLDLRCITPDLSGWNELVELIRKPKRVIPIAIVGKYVELKDAYMSVAEALRHAGLHQELDLDLHWVPAEQVEREGPERLLAKVYGIVVPGGFGDRGIEGKVMAADYARRNNIPYLGLCLGMQCATIAFARHVLGTSEVNSTEFVPHTPNPVIDLMPDQRDITEKGGTMRLGIYPCTLVPGTRAQAAYGVAQVSERHRHRFEFNNKYRAALEEAGFVISGHSPDGRLVEIIELRDHPWFVGSQFHPEFLSRPNRPHPLFRDFVAAAARTQREHEPQQLRLVEPDDRQTVRAWVAVELS